MNTPTALIAEDEPLLRAELREALAALWPQLRVCAEAADGDAAILALDTYAPDILFLDIKMPGATGIEVARRASGRSHVVFVTAYDEYAVAAFEQGAVDYVMKPFSADRLAGTVARLQARMHDAPADLGEIVQALLAQAGRERKHLRWITASRGKELSLVAVEEVLYFMADNKYTRVVTRDTELLIRKPIRELLAELEPDLFWQIHRATLVNITAIAGVRHGLDGHLHVRVAGREESLAVSQPYAHRFKQM
jgi:DNA-binding LytR/AlgR family response regulator